MEEIEELEQRRARFRSIPLRKSAQPVYTTQARAQARRPLPRETEEAPRQSYTSHVHMPAMPDDDSRYVTRVTPTSTIRYLDPYGRQTFQQGRQRMVLSQAKSRRLHWLLPIGATMIGTLVLMVGGLVIVNAWNTHQLDSEYGMPRTWQTDQVLGLNHDSVQHKSHLIFENLNAHVFFEVFPAGDTLKGKVYPVITLFGPDATTIPVTATFEDVNGDGKVDIIVNLGSQGSITYLNTGNDFKPETQQ